jgi:hypothetical protein
MGVGHGSCFFFRLLDWDFCQSFCCCCASSPLRIPPLSLFGGWPPSFCLQTHTRSSRLTQSHAGFVAFVHVPNPPGGAGRAEQRGEGARLFFHSVILKTLMLPRPPPPPLSCAPRVVGSLGTFLFPACTHTLSPLSPSMPCGRHAASPLPQRSTPKKRGRSPPPFPPLLFSSQSSKKGGTQTPHTHRHKTQKEGQNATHPPRGRPAFFPLLPHHPFGSLYYTTLGFSLSFDIYTLTRGRGKGDKGTGQMEKIHKVLVSSNVHTLVVALDSLRAAADLTRTHTRSFAPPPYPFEEGEGGWGHRGRQAYMAVNGYTHERSIAVCHSPFVTHTRAHAVWGGLIRTRDT